MKVRTATIWITCCVMISLGALAQTAVAPPPKPADSGPSLEETMQFIQGKLNDIGKVNFATYWQNTADGSTGINARTQEISNVIANQNQCQISAHWKLIKDGATEFDGDFRYPLRNVREIVVEPYVEYQNEVDAKYGHPTIVSQSTNPPLTALLVRPSNSAWNYLNYFPFADAALADRVAKAMNHAVELCGGGGNEPF